MPIIVFDLDDTLYDEITFVRSGFKAVADFLDEYHGISRELSLPTMLDILAKDGRGRVFDAILIEYGRYSKQLARKCLSVYRAHRPDIQLYIDAVNVLNELGEFPQYIVTDGNKLVQFNKLQALGLTHHNNIRRCFISRRFGIHNEKPSPYCFHLICKLEKTDPHEVVYVGDNPNKDFVGIKPLGFRTIRVMRGHFADLRKPVEYEADRMISDLSELGNIIRNTYSKP